MMDDPFAVFNLPRRFDLDEAALRRAFLEASSQHHPDRFLDPVEQADAVEQMARLTDSYRILRDPESRARALLESSGYELPEDRDKLPAELLMEVMEVREELESAIGNNDATELERLQRWANDRRLSHIQRLEGLFNEQLNAEKAALARLELNALRYMQRMLEQIPDQNQ